MKTNYYTEKLARRFFYLAMALMVALALASISCSRKVTEGNERVEYRDRVTHDTVRIVDIRESVRVDSIVPVVDSLGKVVAYDRWHVRTVYVNGISEKAKVVADVQTKRVVKTVTVAVAKPRRWWEKTLLICGAFAICFVMIKLVGIKIIKNFYSNVLSYLAKK